MNLLDIKYKFLITVFIAGIPIYFGDAIITYNTGLTYFFGMFSFLLMLDMGFIVLFFKMMIESKQQSWLQTYLTIANIGVLWSAFAFLVNNLPHGL